MKVVHTSDWHLMDSQMGRKDRGDDFTIAASAVVELAAAHGAGVIVNSGDLFNVPRPSARKLAELQVIDHQMGERGIKMLIVSGNHDKSDPSWVDIARLENVVNLDDSSVEIGGVKFKGLPFMPASQLKAALRNIMPADVLVLHCAVQELMGFPSKEALTLGDLPTEGFSAIMLGDIHVHDYVQVGPCHVGYPGSIELCSRSEPFVKHVGLFTFDENGNVVGRSSVPLEGTRPVMEFRITTDVDAEAALDALRAHAGRPPLVYLHYRQDMTDVIPKARMAMPGEGILKPLPIPKLKAGKYGELPGDLPDMSRPQDFVANYLPDNTGIHELALKCCVPDSPADVHIAEYIAERLG